MIVMPGPPGPSAQTVKVAESAGASTAGPGPESADAPAWIPKSASGGKRESGWLGKTDMLPAPSGRGAGPSPEAPASGESGGAASAPSSSTGIGGSSGQRNEVRVDALGHVMEAPVVELNADATGYWGGGDRTRHDRPTRRNRPTRTSACRRGHRVIRAASLARTEWGSATKPATPAAARFRFQPPT